jgi:hypothetical protein
VYHTYTVDYSWGLLLLAARNGTAGRGGVGVGVGFGGGGGRDLGGGMGTFLTEVNKCH